MSRRKSNYPPGVTGGEDYFNEDPPDEPPPEQPPSTSLIVPSERGLTMPTQGTPLAHCPTSIPTESFAGRALLLRCSTEPVINLTGDTPLRITARWWALIPGSTVDEETGELSEYTKTVFVSPDGSVFVMTSAHGPKVLLAMLSLVTPEEWADGVPLVIRARRSKRGRTYHDVQIDAGPLPLL